MDEFEKKVEKKFDRIISGTPIAELPLEETGRLLGLCIAAEELLAKRAVYLRMGLSGFKKQLNDEVCRELEMRACALLGRTGVDPNRWIGEPLS